MGKVKNDFELPDVDAYSMQLKIYVKYISEIYKLLHA